MKKLYSTFFLFSVLFLVSCSDKDDDSKVNPNPVPTKCRPVSSSGIAYSNQYGVDSTLYFYDASERLISLVSITSTDTTNITYDQQGRIHKMLRLSGYLLHQYKPTGQLDKITEYHTENPWSNVMKLTNEWVFEYNTGNQLKKVRYVDLVPSQGVPIDPVSYSTFTYNAAGLIAIDSAYYEHNGTRSFVYKKEFLYDNKIGIFHSYWSHAPIKHNITSMTYTRSNGTVYQSTTKYNYNNLGYPVKAQDYDAAGILGRTTNITYECF